MLKGYNFNKEYGVFDDYVSDIYKIKANTKNIVQRNMSKSLLNNLLGRFGIDVSKPITKTVNNEKFDEISTMYKI